NSQAALLPHRSSLQSYRHPHLLPAVGAERTHVAVHRDAQRPRALLDHLERDPRTHALRVEVFEETRLVFELVGDTFDGGALSARPEAAVRPAPCDGPSPTPTPAICAGTPRGARR